MEHKSLEECKESLGPRAYRTLPLSALSASVLSVPSLLLAVIALSYQTYKN